MHRACAPDGDHVGTPPAEVYEAESVCHIFAFGGGHLFRDTPSGHKFLPVPLDFVVVRHVVRQSCEVRKVQER